MADPIIGALPDPELLAKPAQPIWTPVFQSFMAGLRGSAPAMLQGWNEAINQTYIPQGATQVNDAGMFMNAQGQELPATYRPAVLPVTREAGALTPAMPGMLDVAYTLGGPVPKGKVLGAGVPFGKADAALAADVAEYEKIMDTLKALNTPKAPDPTATKLYPAPSVDHGVKGITPKEQELLDYLKVYAPEKYPNDLKKILSYHADENPAPKKKAPNLYTDPVGGLASVKAIEDFKEMFKKSEDKSISAFTAKWPGPMYKHDIPGFNQVGNKSDQIWLDWIKLTQPGNYADEIKWLKENPIEVAKIIHGDSLKSAAAPLKTNDFITNAGLNSAEEARRFMPENPVDEATRQANRVAMGMDLPFFHGSMRPFEGNVINPEDAPRFFGETLAFNNRTVPELADMYSAYTQKPPRTDIEVGGYGGYPNHANIMPMYAKSDEFHVFDAEGQTWSHTPKNLSFSEYAGSVQSQAIDQAKKAGKKGVIMKNTWDEPLSPYNVGLDSPRDLIIAFPSATIRSAFAQFDPKKATSKDLLASLSALGLIALNAEDADAKP